MYSKNSALNEMTRQQAVTCLNFLSVTLQEELDTATSHHSLATARLQSNSLPRADRKYYEDRVAESSAIIAWHDKPLIHTKPVTDIATMRSHYAIHVGISGCIA